MCSSTAIILDIKGPKIRTYDFLKEIDEVIIVAGMPTTHIGGTNMLKIERV